MNNLRRILTSFFVVGVVASAGVLASRAFFSDTETSTGNILQAGAIDLLIDNESYVTDESGALVASASTSWGLDDLAGHLFFNFFDLKPGDVGEDTISVHVNNNDAYVCAAAQITEDSDVDYSEPELEVDTTTNPANPFGGELGSQLNFAFWADDGDNVYESGEHIFVQGPVSGLGTLGQIALADSSTNIWNASQTAGPVNGGETYYIGKAWCMGSLTSLNLPNNASTGPLTRGTGFKCDGDTITNAAQTDRVMGDIEFYAVQSRNNSGFTCASNYTPSFPTAESSVKVGAALAEYQAPQICDVTVNGGTIAAGIASAVNGNTVCVADGTYTENVTINKDITLAALNGPTATSTINGLVDLTADGATITGFEITPGVIPNQEAAITMTANNTAATYNFIHGMSSTAGGSIKGIYAYNGNSAFVLSGFDIQHNVIDDITNSAKGTYGVMIQGKVSDVNVLHNTITDLTSPTGWGASAVEITPTSAFVFAPQNVAVMYNHIEGMGSGTTEPGKAVTIDWANASNVSEASEVVVRFNNFIGAALGIRNLDSDTLYAPNNWFGVTTDVQGNVNYMPKASSAYAVNP